MGAIRIISNDTFFDGEHKENYEWLVNGKIWRLEFRYNLNYFESTDDLNRAREDYFKDNYAPEDAHLVSIMVSDKEYDRLKKFLKI